MFPHSDLLQDDGKCPPSKPSLDWENDIVYLPFSSTSNKNGCRGIMHTSRSLMGWFFQPDNTGNHILDQMCGDSLACGNHFFHMSGFYAVALAAIHGVSVFCLSDYSDDGFLEMIADQKIPTATLYPWQVRMLSQNPIVSKFDLACLKSVITGGDILSPTIRAELYDRHPNIKYVRECYGLNECGFVTLTYPR